MITFNRFGNYGNLGNQLFQLATLIGFSKKYGCEYKVAPWKWANHFKGNIPQGKVIADYDLQEPSYHYTPEHWDKQAGLFQKHTVNLTGWLQSEKYWQNCIEDVRKALEFTDETVNHVLAKNSKAFGRKTIAISIRRGDYVDNPNYVLLPIQYYYLALFNHFPDWRNYNLLIFSDDLTYCRHHFGCLSNAYFIEGNPVEQLCAMSLCDNAIIANSTFSWWGAYLQNDRGKVIRPNYLFAGQLLKTHNDKDFYQERWINFDHVGKRIDLSDVTFTIPVSYDHPDRKENIYTTAMYLRAYFDMDIVIGEQGGNEFEPIMQKACIYYSFNYQTFHRTRMLNVMAGEATTPIVCNYDADVLLPPLQILEAVHQIRTGKADFVYPYDGRFARVPRRLLPTIKKRMDTGELRCLIFEGTKPGQMLSVGGCLFVNREKFFEAGGENEKMISYAPEDLERKYRFEKLGYKVTRIPGQLYHIDHYISENSSTKHRYFTKNLAEWERIQRMDAKQLRQYVDTWPKYSPPVTP